MNAHPCRQCGGAITRSKQARFCSDKCVQRFKTLARKRPKPKCSREMADKIVRLLMDDPGAATSWRERFGALSPQAPARAGFTTTPEVDLG